MHLSQSRRDFLTSMSVASAAAAFGGGTSLAAEPPPETTTIRLRLEDVPPNMVSGVAEIASCNAPLNIAGDLLRAEGFTDVRQVPVKPGPAFTQAFAQGEIDFGLMFTPGAVSRLDAHVPITVLAGVHPGCFALFAQESIRTFVDLKGKQVGIPVPFGSAEHLYVSIMAAHVGLDPKTDINWVTTDDVAIPMDLFFQGRIDAYLAFVSEFPGLRARRIGRVIVDMALDRPWSQYYCCMVAGNADFVRQYPIGTKRALRAILKATDLCATDPERAARQLVVGGFAYHYDIALQVIREMPYNVWRELDPEDSLRFYALWMHEFGELEATPNQIITAGTDWRFVNELKRELKA